MRRHAQERREPAQVAVHGEIGLVHHRRGPSRALQFVEAADVIAVLMAADHVIDSVRRLHADRLEVRHHVLSPHPGIARLEQDGGPSRSFDEHGAAPPDVEAAYDRLVQSFRVLKQPLKPKPAVASPLAVAIDPPIATAFSSSSRIALIASPIRAA